MGRPPTSCLLERRNEQTPASSQRYGGLLWKVDESSLLQKRATSKLSSLKVFEKTTAETALELFAQSVKATSSWMMLPSMSLANPSRLADSRRRLISSNASCSGGPHLYLVSLRMRRRSGAINARPLGSKQLKKLQKPMNFWISRTFLGTGNDRRTRSFRSGTDINFLSSIDEKEKPR